jgi:hypothetical protein
VQFSSLPYPGLRSFRYDESDIFFGREKQTDQLLARLARRRFLAVTGASGCGKSSLVKAGLIPALNAGFMAAPGSRWRICDLRPGDRPLEGLSRVLARPEILGADGDSEKSTTFVEAALRRGPLGLIEIARGTAALQDTNLLVLVDQFEEIFRHPDRIVADEADAFVALLLTSARQGEAAIYVVITMRSDYLGECAAFHRLPEAVSDSQYLTPRLTREELEQAITGPARVFGGSVDARLVNRLINDFGAEADQLPLLQHALARMWAGCAKSSTSPLLTVEEYDAIGGRAALSNHGDEIYAELSPEQQRVAAIMFKRLSGSEDGRRDVRYSARVHEVAEIAADGPSSFMGEVIAVAEAFRRPDRCFLAVPEGPVQQDTLLDLSHESLIRHWLMLAGWVAEEARSAETYQRLRDWAVRWKRHDAELWSGPDLASAIAWQQHSKPSPAWAERYRDNDQPRDQFDLARNFIVASRRRHRMWWVQRLALISGSAAASLAAAVLIYDVGWGWERDIYYKDYVKVWGVPEGIGKLSAAEVRHRSRSYKITTEGVFGPVLSIEAVNAEGQPANGIEKGSIAPVELATAVSRSKYVYDHAVLLFESFLNRRHQVVGGVFYSPSATEDPRRSRMAYFFGKNNALGSQTGSCAVRLQYDYSEIGHETLLHYFDREGNPTPGKDNALMKKHEFDNLGHITSEISLDKDGLPINDQSGNAEMRIRYDRRTGDVIAEESLDLAGKPLDFGDLDGKWQKLTREYDQWGNLREEVYWHEDGAPAEINGCHSIRLSYNDRGNFVRGLCLQSDGKPSESDFAAWTVNYDEDDNAVEYTLFDLEDRPLSRVRKAYDEEGNLTRIAYFDGTDKPITNAGYHQEVIEYKNGHPVRTEHLGTDLKRVAGNGGLWAIKESSFDVCGREIGVQLSDAEGHRRAVIKKAYDENNHVADETCQAEGSSCSEYAYDSLSYDGYARITRKFDRNGNVTKEDYFDTENHPAKKMPGYTEITHRFDDHNNLIEDAYFDRSMEVNAEQGEPVEVSDTDSKRQCAKFVYHYDVDGQQTGSDCFDARGNSVAPVTAE